MKKRPRIDTGVIMAICLSLSLAAYAQTNFPAPTPPRKGAPVTTHAKGTFDVKITPQTPDGKFEDASMGRMTIDKQFHGDLEGASKGQMLTAMTEIKGSAGYVAVERVTGTLNGRSGTFFLQHSATMTRGKPQLSVTVVPDSGTGQLVGLTGKMDIIINAGKHSYDFEYTLPATTK
ncbi:MAG: DUF3224 domain-containing protein [Terriglobales bacterium]|jgi:uncharacterized protein DUF3224